MRSINRHSIKAYEKIVATKLRLYRGNRDMAFAACVGAVDLETFASQGDGHVEVLRHYGLQNGMSLYDLGCGCGRTAQALERADWTGCYRGADIIKSLVEQLKRKSPSYDAIVHRHLSIAAPDNSLDVVFHWSVFTHLLPEESYVYMADTFRALKPAGKLIFSFLEMEDPAHQQLFRKRARAIGNGVPLLHLDTFLHRDTIRFWARDLGFSEPEFTDGSDTSKFPAFWQAVAAMEKR